MILLYSDPNPDNYRLGCKGRNQVGWVTLRAATDRRLKLLNTTAMVTSSLSDDVRLIDLQVWGDLIRL